MVFICILPLYTNESCCQPTDSCTRVNQRPAVAIKTRMLPVKIYLAFSRPTRHLLSTTRKGNRATFHRIHSGAFSLKRSNRKPTYLKYMWVTIILACKECKVSKGYSHNGLNALCIDIYFFRGLSGYFKLVLYYTFLILTTNEVNCIKI